MSITKNRLVDLVLNGVKTDHSEFIEVLRETGGPNQYLSREEVQSLDRIRNEFHTVPRYNAQMTFFQWLCTLIAADSLIVTCIEHGALLDQPNTNLKRYPIHFACDSLVVENVRVIAKAMWDRGISFNLMYRGRTSLTQVADTLNKSNALSCINIFKILMENVDDIDIQDWTGDTPISLLWEKVSLGADFKNLVKFIFEKCGSDKRIQISYRLLKRHLEEKREQGFIKDLKHVLELTGEDDVNHLVAADEPTLLQIAVEKDLVLAVKALIAHDAIVNPFCSGVSKAKLDELKQNEDMMKELFNFTKPADQKDSKSVSLLCIAAKSDDKGKYQDFFNLLINHAGININETDFTGSTALHYACRNNNREAIVALLERNAYIGIENKDNKTAIEDIAPEILQNHFDNRIRHNQCGIGDAGFEIEVDFSNFCSVKHFGDRTEFSGAMETLMAIVKTKDLKHLITHPLITSFLSIKWLNFFPLFLVNLIFYSVFCTALLLHLVFFYERPESCAFSNSCYTLIIIGLVCVTVRETFQFILNPCNYLNPLKQFQNYFETTLIIMIVYLVVQCGSYSSGTRIVASMTILFAVIELSLLISALPFTFVSTHLVMLKRVSISFLKFLGINSAFIVGFAFCFYTLFNDGIASRNVSSNDMSEEDRFNSFANPGASIIKTIVMMTGEFETASMNFHVNQFSYFIFCIFVFFMSIVLFNLLNGLAVSDTAIIKAQAEQYYFVEKVYTLHRFEKLYFNSKFNCFCCFCSCSWINSLRSKCYSIAHIFPNFQKYFIYPNTGNRIKVLKQTASFTDHNENSYCLNCFEFSCSTKEQSETINNELEMIDNNHSKVNKHKVLETSVLIPSVDHNEKEYLTSTNRLFRCLKCFGCCFSLERNIVKELKECIKRRRKVRGENREKAFLEQKILAVEEKTAEIKQETLELHAKLEKLDEKISTILTKLTNLEVNRNIT